MKKIKFLALALGLILAMPMFLTADEQEVEIQLMEVMGSLPGDNPFDGSGPKASFIIYDAMGKMVKIGTIFATHQINVANLCPGAYIIRLCNCGSFEYIKFIKE